MTTLVAYRSSQVTPDTAYALRSLERGGHTLGKVRIHYQGVPASLLSWEGVQSDPGPTGMPPHLSFRPTGREVYLRLELMEYQGPAELRAAAELSALWALAVPLGFVPWSRWPVSSNLDQVFHYLGPWASLGDFLQGQGLGDAAWPSMCTAAQCEMGKWQGTKLVERTVQMHLHRLGIHCGPVNGIIGVETLQALRAMGLGGLEMAVALDQLQEVEDHTSRSEEGNRRVGHFSMEGHLPEAFTSGSVQTIKTKTGYVVTSTGSGRLILLFSRSIDHE